MAKQGEIAHTKQVIQVTSTSSADHACYQILKIDNSIFDSFIIIAPGII